jgi:two-component system chemotaxis response regulator CheY
MPDLSLPVLLVDDYTSMRRTIRSMLQHIGFTDITEDDGTGAQVLLQERRFGLIISDLLMTPVTGIDLLRGVRDDPRIAGTPFVLVTGAAQHDLVLTAMQLHVDDYVVKPFDTSTLQRKLLALLQRSDSPERRQALVAKADERRSGPEARRDQRYSEPALQVTIGAQTYRTVEWSVGGLSIAGFSGALPTDNQLSLSLRIEGDDDESRSFSGPAVVVRSNSGTGALAVRFPSQVSPTRLALAHLHQ